MPDTTAEPLARRAAWLGYAALFVLLSVIYMASPVTNRAGDSTLVIPTAASIAYSRNLDVDEFADNLTRRHYSNREINGHHYNYFPWTVSLFAVPGVLAVDAADAVGVGPGTQALIATEAAHELELLIAAVVAAAAAGVVAALAALRLDAFSPRTRLRAGLGVGLIFGLGTSMWSIASRALWQHGPSILCGSVALLLATRIAGGRAVRPLLTAAGLGAVLALGYTIRPTNLAPLVVLGVWLGWQHRRLLGGFAGGAAAVLVPWMAVNWWSVASLLGPYQSTGRLAWHADYVDAVAANLVSPSRGLFVMTPIVVLAIVGMVRVARAGSHDRLEWACLVIAVLHLLGVSALTERWWAGHSYGPRFMSDVLPYLLVMALPAITVVFAHRSVADAAKAPLVVAVSALALVGVVIHAEGALVRSTACWNAEPRDLDEDPSRIWSVTEPQVLHWRTVLDETGSWGTARTGTCPFP